MVKNSISNMIRLFSCEWLTASIVNGNKKKCGINSSAQLFLCWKHQVSARLSQEFRAQVSVHKRFGWHMITVHCFIKSSIVDRTVHIIDNCQIVLQLTIGRGKVLSNIWSTFHQDAAICYEIFSDTIKKREMIFTPTLICWRKAIVAQQMFQGRTYNLHSFVLYGTLELWILLIFFCSYPKMIW